MSDVRTAAYDAVAVAYDAQFRHELAAKPLDRALLSAFAELTASGTLADVGCGPGHVTEFLARHHPAVLGVDLSPAMITIARARAPQLDFRVETMLDLSEGEGCWAGAVALYSIIQVGVVVAAASAVGAFDLGDDQADAFVVAQGVHADTAATGGRQRARSTAPVR